MHFTWSTHLHLTSPRGKCGDTCICNSRSRSPGGGSRSSSVSSGGSDHGCCSSSSTYYIVVVSVVVGSSDRSSSARRGISNSIGRGAHLRSAWRHILGSPHQRQAPCRDRLMLQLGKREDNKKVHLAGPKALGVFGHEILLREIPRSVRRTNSANAYLHWSVVAREARVNVWNIAGN